MTRQYLIPFWIRTSGRRAPLGFGVTGWSLEDALWILRYFQYDCYLPDDLAELQFQAGITFAELDQNHIISNMGPMVVRGMWYPFVMVGMPRYL
jgi:hypothetical protein